TRSPRRVGTGALLPRDSGGAVAGAVAGRQQHRARFAATGAARDALRRERPPRTVRCGAASGAREPSACLDAPHRARAGELSPRKRRASAGSAPAADVSVYARSRFDAFYRIETGVAAD